MTDDPIAQLRRQLVDAGDRRADARRAAAPPRSPRPRRRGTWLAVGAVLIATPAAAVATGITEFGTAGNTAGGSTYEVQRVTDAQASTDPSRRDGVGRTCEVSEVRDRAGKLVSRNTACRPADAPPSRSIIGAGFSLLPDDKLLVRGSVNLDVDRVTISGHGPVDELKPDSKTDRRVFFAVLPLKRHEIVAIDNDGRELGRTSIEP